MHIEGIPEILLKVWTNHNLKERKMLRRKEQGLLPGINNNVLSHPNKNMQFTADKRAPLAARNTRLSVRSVLRERSREDGMMAWSLFFSCDPSTAADDA
jgi:hypothetical protein